MLSELIHNPFVNNDLNKRGLGKNLILKTIENMKHNQGNYLYIGYLESACVLRDT